jgi:hypothetical protein
MRMPAVADQAWAGIDVGKRHHWVCVVGQDGRQLLSVKVANDEAGIGAVIGSVAGLAGEITWAVDIIGAPSALLLAVLSQAGQHVRYASGRLVAAMSGAYAGEGKTDPKDAYVIAETARLRRNLPVIGRKTDLVCNLGLLTARRSDLIADRVRMINRLRDLLTSVFPALEREFDYSSCKGALVLLTGYACPARLRRTGEARLASWLRQRRVRGYAGVAARAVTAAQAQRITLPGQDIAAGIISEIARSLLALDQRVAELDTQIAAMSAEHPQAAIIESMPPSVRNRGCNCFSRAARAGAGDVTPPMVAVPPA